MTPDFDNLIMTVRAHHADFYREKWERETDLAKLPFVSRSDMCATPLSRRRYKDTKGLLKVVHTKEGAFASEWDFEDIKRESYALPSARPMIALTDPHETIEKSLAYKLSGTLALIAERNSDVTLQIAKRFEITSLLADAASLELMRPYLEARSEMLDHITVIGDSFDTATLSSSTAYAHRIRLLLALPETGTLAEASLETYPNFRALPGVYLESKDGVLAVSCNHLLVTPIIRYLTGIRARIDGDQIAIIGTERFV